MYQRLLDPASRIAAVHNPHRALAASVLVALLATLNCASAADDYKIIKLEQDVRNLERQVQELTRQIADLQQRSSRSSIRAAPADNSSSGTQPVPNTWLVGDHWKQVHPGMNEMDVIQLLGPPTTMRTDPATHERQLFYALEIGTNAFLSGSVTIKDRQVTSVEIPTLK